MLLDLTDQKSLKPLDEEQQINLNKFLALLRKWNKTRNLVSRKTSIRDLNHHVIDCLAPVSYTHLTLPTILPV